MSLTEVGPEIDWDELDKQLTDGGNGFGGNGDGEDDGEGWDWDGEPDPEIPSMAGTVGGLGGAAAGLIVSKGVLTASNRTLHTPNALVYHDDRGTLWNVAHVGMHEKTQVVEVAGSIFVCAALGIAIAKKTEQFIKERLDNL